MAALGMAAAAADMSAAPDARMSAVVGMGMAAAVQMAVWKWPRKEYSSLSELANRPKSHLSAPVVALGLA